MALASAAKKSMEIVKVSKMPKILDIDVKIIGGQNFVRSHGIWFNPSYFIEIQLGEEKMRTSASPKGEKNPDWNETFVFATDLSAHLIIKVYCKHGHRKDDHVIGEITLNLLKTARNEYINIDVYDPTKETAKVLRGHLLLYLRVSRLATFTSTDGVFSASDLQAIPQDVISWLSLEQVQKLSPAWNQFLLAFYSVVSQTLTLFQVYPFSQVAIAAVAFAVKVVIDQMVRDEKIERLIQIVGDLYIYLLDGVSIQKILTYKTTLERVLSQTSECAYFIGNYQELKPFAQRAVVHMVSDSDAMITRFENAFGELKIELVLGSSLQTAVVSFRILQKVENIENLMYINSLPYSKSVSWDSGRACLHGTRQDIINKIISWATNMTKTQQSRLCLLRGPPGCGKSSIAHTISQIFHQQNRLAAAVFLDGCVDQKVNTQTVGSTIAYQLAGYDATIRQRMAELIKADFSLASANIERQLPELIGAATHGLTMIGPIVIVVDDLVDPQEQHRLLTAIANSSTSLPANFCLVLTSRNGSKLADTLQNEANWSIQDIGFDDTGDGSLDIGKYIHQCLRQLSSIKPNLFQRYTLEGLSKLLLPRALGMHYWVTTAYRLLLSSSEGNDCSILDEILSNPLPLSKQEAMDHVYRATLHVLRDISLPVPVDAIFHVLIQSPPTFSPSSARRIRPVAPKHARAPLEILEELDGMIEIGRDQQGLPLFRLHPSFGEFIINPQRCGTTGFHVDRHLPPAYPLAELCLDEMNHKLTQNLCQLDDLMVLDEEILDREDRILHFIPITLQYACCQWILHLELTSYIDPVVPKIQKFLFTHLLHWFEVISMLGHFQLILPFLERLAAWIKKYSHRVDARCHIMTMDGIRFIRAFSPILSKAAMQTYISALPLMQPDTLLFKIYHTETTAGRSDLQSHSPSGWAILNAPAEWNTNLALDMKTSSFASSGYLIAQAECYPTNRVRFYNSRTGHEVGLSLPLQLPAESMHFSPDGRRISTVDSRGIISIWDIKKGLLTHHIKSDFQHPLIHYSASGDRILIGGLEPHKHRFGDKFSVWNTTTAKCIREFVFNISYWHNIALSPDGMKLAVHERNKVGIRIFDIESGELVGKPSLAIKGGVGQETLLFKKVIWSSNGDLLATVSMQDSICLWNTDSGSFMLLQDLNGSGGALSCLAFSPDNSCIAVLYSYSKSASGEDRRNSHARIWNTLTRKIVWSETIPAMEYSMSFLPDSQEILFFVGELNNPPIRIVRLPAHMSYPPNIYEWTPGSHIQYSRLTSGTNVNFTSQVDGEGWVINTAGERQVWVPYPGFELHSEDRVESDEQQESFLQRKTLEVKDPKTSTVVLRLKIDFKLKNE